MSELKTNPLDREPITTSMDPAPDETSKNNTSVKARCTIINAAALLAASATTPDTRDIKKVISDFRLAVSEVKKSY